MQDRFEMNVMPEPNSGCHIWLGSVYASRGGYGAFTVDGRSQRAHRIAYALYRCDPGEAHVLHRCDNRVCVNPDHLFLGDQQTNMKDKRRKQRAPSGRSHWNYKHGGYTGRFARRTDTIRRYQQE